MKLSAIAAGVALTLATAAHAQSIGHSDQLVRIGVLSDLSGPYSDLAGRGSVLAAQLAVEDFKARAKPAFAIDVVSADHQNKPDIASARARQWFDQEKVDMITDVPTSNAAIATIRLGQEKNRIVTISSAATPRITNEDCGATTFHWTYDSYAVANATARAIVKQGGNTWYFITGDYLGGTALEKDATTGVQATGGKVLGAVRHPFPGNADFSSFLLTAKNSGAKVIGIANAGNDTVATIKQAVEFGLTQKQSLAATLMFITDVHSIGLSDAQGMYLTEAFYWDQTEQTRAWSRRMFEKLKRMPTSVQAGVYSATLHYLKAVQAAGTDEAKAVAQKMRELKVNDFFTKDATVRADGRVVRDMYLYQVKKPADSKYPWDYYHVRQAIPGDQAFLAMSESKCPLVAQQTAAAPK